MTQSSVLFLKPWRMLFSINGRKVSGGTSACGWNPLLHIEFAVYPRIWFVQCSYKIVYLQFILKRGLLGSCGGQILADVVR